VAQANYEIEHDQLR